MITYEQALEKYKNKRHFNYVSASELDRLDNGYNCFVFFQRGGSNKKSIDVMLEIIFDNYFVKSIRFVETNTSKIRGYYTQAIIIKGKEKEIE
jgi:hypothetical protein